MKLIVLHRVLILAAIVFCFGFAAYELDRYHAERSALALGLSILFGVAGVALVVYLLNLRRFVRLE